VGGGGEWGWERWEGGCLIPRRGGGGGGERTVGDKTGGEARVHRQGRRGGGAVGVEGPRRRRSKDIPVTGPLAA